MNKVIFRVAATLYAGILVFALVAMMLFLTLYAFAGLGLIAQYIIEALGLWL